MPSKSLPRGEAGLMVEKDIVISGEMQKKNLERLSSFEGQLSELKKKYELLLDIAEPKQKRTVRGRFNELFAVIEVAKTVPDSDVVQVIEEGLSDFISELAELQNPWDKIEPDVESKKRGDSGLPQDSVEAISRLSKINQTVFSRKLFEKLPVSLKTKVLSVLSKLRL